MTNKKLSSTALIIMLMLSIAAIFTVSPVLAAQPYIAVSPEHTVFMAPTVNATFSISINISSPNNPFSGWEVLLYWEREYINATSFTAYAAPVWTAPFFAGAGIIWNFNATHGKFSRSCADVPDPPPAHNYTGNLKAVQINFKIIDVPEAPGDPDALIPLVFSPGDTYLAYTIPGDPNPHMVTPLYRYNGDVFLKALMAAPPTIWVDTDKDLIMDAYPETVTGVMGVNFTIDLAIKDVVTAHNVWGWEVIMWYNTTLLDCVGITEGDFLANFAPSGHNGTYFVKKFGSMYDPAYINTTYEDNEHNRINYIGYGKIDVACLFVENHTAPTGAGVLATIEFTPTFQTLSGEDIAWTWLWIEGNTSLADHPEQWPGPPPGAIPHNSYNGKYIAPVLSAGRDIDSFTDSYRKYGNYYTQYTGRDPQMNADVYAPQDLVIIFALVKYNDEPVQNKPVQFEIRPRNKYTGEDRDVIGFPLYRVALTNATGIANITFRIPWPCDDPYSVMGGWYVYQSVDIACQKVFDEEWFEVAWPVEITKVMVWPDPAYKCNTTIITIDYTNHALTALPVYFTVVLYDHQMTPIGMDFLEFIADPGVWCNATEGQIELHVHIPKWAYVGIPNSGGDSYPWPYPAAYVNAYTFRCSEGGMPYCPEAFDTFEIRKA